MPRARMLKPEFFDDYELAQLPPHDRLAYQGLWCLADRAGRLDDHPHRLRARLFPFEPAVDMDAILTRLAAHWIVRYVGSDGRRYLAVRNLPRHQHFHIKEPPSSIPAPDEHRSSTGRAPGQHGAKTQYTDTDTDTDTDTEDTGSAGADRRAPEDDGFDAFWAAYPRHENKAKALKAWKALKPSPAMQEIILRAIADQRTWRQWREGFIPHPTTWLHGRRWDDERPADDRGPANRAPVAVSDAWCEHDPPCRTQSEHIQRALDADRALRVAVPA